MTVKTTFLHGHMLAASVVFIILTASSTFPFSAAALFAVRPARISTNNHVNHNSALPRILKSSDGYFSNRHRRTTVLNYADEWVDADYELAFNTGRGNNNAASTSTPSNKQQQNNSVGISFFTKLCRFFYMIKESVRTKLEKCTVYVLECEEGKYYVGSTQNRKRRWKQHERGRGSQWTRLYKPLRVIREEKRIPHKFLLGLESKITAECMLEFGVNNVRGSMFCSPRDYHVGDVHSLTKFLGHYCDLNYRKVSARLSQTLPAIPGKSHRPTRCYCCGKFGHKTFACPERATLQSSSSSGGSTSDGS